MRSQHGRTKERDQEGRQRLFRQEAQEIRGNEEEWLRGREGRKEALKVDSDTNADRAETTSLGPSVTLRTAWRRRRGVRAVRGGMSLIVTIVVIVVLVILILQFI